MPLADIMHDVLCAMYYLRVAGKGDGNRRQRSGKRSRAFAMGMYPVRDRQG